MKLVSRGLERLDAIGDAGLAGRVGDRGEGLSRALPCRHRVAARRHRALAGRAVDQHRAAELGAELDQPQHHIKRALAQLRIRSVERQARRRHQQPVQAGDDDAGVADGAPQLRARIGAEHVRLVGHRERRHLQPVIAERRRIVALRGEFHVAEHFVAQRDLHGLMSCAAWP